jgi:hypothetical protein
VQRPAVPMVAGVEAVLGHKLLESHASSRHASKSRTELGDSLEESIVTGRDILNWRRVAVIFSCKKGGS